MPTSEFAHKIAPDIVAEQIEKIRLLLPWSSPRARAVRATTSTGHLTPRYMLPL